ncbi:MAG: GPO family capsid scaffolding protein [Hydrogenovibrio crunogenus]|nr:GPO family capsid scaffolding protein [Hydrogenovibrio crunogenus]
MILTDFICILTAGHTVDGRHVADEVLDQIAESYNPETYSARINIEHSQFGYKLGSVLAVKTEVVGGVKKLFAQLKPTDYMLTLIQAGQKLHTSAEIVMDFAQTGKAYLTGLALTDTPASLGTTELKLSVENAGKTHDVQMFSTGDFIEPGKPKKNLLSNLANFLSQEDEEMDATTAQLLKEMNDTQSQTATLLAATTKSVDALAEKLTAIIGAGSGDAPAAKGDESGQVEGLAKNEEFAALKEEVTQLSTTLKGFEDAMQKFTDDVNRQQATGGSTADDEENVVL